MGSSIKAKYSNVLKPIRSSITRPANTTAYAAGDAISNVTTDAHLTYAKASEGDSFHTGEIIGVRFYSSVVTTTLADFTLHLFHTDFTAVADNAAFTLTDAEGLRFIGSVSVVVANWETATLNKYAFVSAAIPFKSFTDATDDASSSIYGQLVADAAYVPASGEIITVDILSRHD